MAYLRRWLPEWSDERASKADYRFLFLDDYRVHNMIAVSDFCWSRGFLKIKVGGGCTFILMTCDLDLHSYMEQDLQELDVEWAEHEQRQRPWAVPSKTLQNQLDDIASFWFKHPHAQIGIDSHELCGLSARPQLRNEEDKTVPKVGPDDWRINRDARAFFIGNDMQEERRVALSRIYEDLG